MLPQLDGRRPATGQHHASTAWVIVVWAEAQ
jgi:hypothetical protein